MRKMESLPVRWGLELTFEKNEKQTRRLYCAFPTEAEAQRALNEIQNRLRRGVALTFGWVKLVFETDWLFRNMPRKSTLAKIELRELHAA